MLLGTTGTSQMRYASTEPNIGHGQSKSRADSQVTISIAICSEGRSEVLLDGIDNSLDTPE